MTKKLTASILTLALAFCTALPAVWADSADTTPVEPTAVVQELAAADAVEATEESNQDAKIFAVVQLRNELNQLQKERAEHRRILEDLKAKSETITTLKAKAKENGEIRKLEKARDIEKLIHRSMDQVEKLRQHKNNLWADFHNAFKDGHMNQAEQILQNIVRDKMAINTVLHGVEKLMNSEILVLK